MPFLDDIRGAVVMAPMTKGSNLPYRRLAAELGARVIVSEMVVARRLKQKRRGEFALIRRAPDSSCFGIQLAGNQPDEMAWAAELVWSRGADFVDLNLGCPIDHFTRKGLGAALARKPGRVERIVSAMRKAVPVPVTVKIRLGWDADHCNFLDIAKAAVDAGAAALTVHGRTREARYRHPADWDAIRAVVDAVPVPVIGNGDLLFGHEIRARFDTSGCAGVMTGRGALIKPWIFGEATNGDRDISAEERLTIYRRYVELGREHWRDEPRLREFLHWHVGFWVRYQPRKEDGTWPTMQTREPSRQARNPLEALLTRADEAALDYITDELLHGGDFASPPPVGVPAAEQTTAEAG